MLETVVDGDFLQVPEKRRGGRFVEGKGECTSKSEATDPVQIADIDASAGAVDDALKALKLLAWVNPIAAVEDEFVDPRPDLGVGGWRKIFVPPKVQGEVVVEVGKNDARGGV